MILETERLFLRELCQTDFRDLAKILQNPKVMYAYEHDFSDDDVQIWLNRQINRYKKYAFVVLNRDKVCSVIKADNLASIKVAESIGMSKEDEFITQYYNGDMLHFLYSVHR